MEDIIETQPTNTKKKQNHLPKKHPKKKEPRKNKNKRKQSLQIIKKDPQKSPILKTCNQTYQRKAKERK